MKEISLQSIEELNEIMALSFSEEIDGVFIFKHSTRCSISSMVWNRLQRDWKFDPERVKFYYLDLIRYREVSNKIAELTGVEHQSPQLIGIKNGKAFYDASHTMIRVLDAENALKKGH